MADNPNLCESVLCESDHYESVSKEGLTVTWSELTVEVGHGKDKRKTLSSFSGQLRSKELVAVLGPSGSGKTTFLKCLTLKQRPHAGQVGFYSAIEKCDISYVSQTDDLYVYLTVEESLLFASQFKNKFDTTNDHNKKVRSVIEQFRLEKCFKNIVHRCSGGEMRRLSIALEMVSDPDLVVLDEPTTGLDSFTALSCMQTIANAVRTDNSNRQLAVLMTIHQPNTELFYMFDRVYILSSGQCIYDGAPRAVPDNFKYFDLHCPQNSNPADFIMDIACKGSNDATVLTLHTAYLKDQSKTQLSSNLEVHRIAPEQCKRHRAFLDGLMVNTKRLLLSNVRDPQQSFTRLLLFLLVPFLIWALATRESFESSACVYEPINQTHINPETSYKIFDRRKLALQNVYYIVFNLFFIMLNSSYPATFSFTNFVRALMKEYQNNWYTFNAFFVAFVVIQSLFALFYAFSNSLAFYFIAPEWFTLKTFICFALVNGFVSIFGDVYGFLGGTIMARNMILAIMLVTVANFVVMCLSDFTIQIQYLNPNFKFLYDLSTFQHCYKLLLKLVFQAEPCLLSNDMTFNIRKVQDFIRFFNFETGHGFDDLEDVNEKVWLKWEDKPWSKSNVTSFMVNRYCPLENTTCSEQLKTELNHFWDSKVNMIANEYLLADVDISQHILYCIGLVLIHYILCYCVALIRAMSK